MNSYYIRKAFLTIILGVLAVSTTFGQGKGKPIIDMHLHAFDFEEWRDFFGLTDSQENYEKRTFELLEKYNIYGATSGPRHMVTKWMGLNPKRIIPGLFFFTPEELNLDSLRSWHAEGSLAVLGEIMIQYKGIRADDPRMIPIWEIASELNIPLAIHSLPYKNAPYAGFPEMRASVGRPLILEDMLVKYPNVKFQLVHAGWPFIDETIALLEMHPQVYVGIGNFSSIPDADSYLKRLVDAGFANRIMYGSDQMFWPEEIEESINWLNSLNFLNDAQKRDVFYNNAAKFLGLDLQTISNQHDN